MRCGECLLATSIPTAAHWLKLQQLRLSVHSPCLTSWMSDTGAVAEWRRIGGTFHLNIKMRIWFWWSYILIWLDSRPILTPSCIWRWLFLCKWIFLYLLMGNTITEDSGNHIFPFFEIYINCMEWMGCMNGYMLVLLCWYWLRRRRVNVKDRWTPMHKYHQF